MAASAGAKMTAAACAMLCDTATGQKLGNSGSDRQARVTMTAAPIIIIRFARVASTSAPAGVCAMMPARVEIDITIPIRASSHFCSVSR